MQKVFRSLIIVIIIIILLLPIFLPQKFTKETLPEYTKRASDSFHSMQASELEEASYTWDNIDTIQSDEVKDLIFNP